MTLEALNALPREQAEAELLKCCGSRRWAAAMAARRPFPHHAGVMNAADEEWARVMREDVLEAFAHHPRIGGKDALRKKFQATSAWSQGEQAMVSVASEKTLDALSRGNKQYEKKFGYIFIVCATGKSADEMLALLRQRLPNDPDAELKLAAAEQAKITQIRLAKLLAS